MGTHKLRSLTVALAAIIVACESAPPAVTPTAPVRGGTLITAVASDIATLQPVLANSDGVWPLIYAPLLATDPATGEARPNLAERAEQSPDGRRITFTLREGLVWSDGTPLTGEDYRYRVEAVARSQKTASKGDFSAITGWNDYVKGRTDHIAGIVVSAAGRVVQIDLDRASCPAVSTLAVAPLPKHVFIKDWDNTTTDTTRNIDASPLNNAPPVASGPFVLSEWVPNDHIKLVRNDQYFKGAPLLDAWVFKVLGPNSLQALAAGEVDIAQVADIQNVPAMKNAAGARFADYRVVTPGYTFVAWNEHAPRAPWLADRRVRQALWYGTDVQHIVDGILTGAATRIFAHTPPMSWAADTSGLEHYDYDPAHARTLLESAGAQMGSDGIYRWTDGSPMRLRLESQTGLRGSIAQAIAEQYKSIGVSVELQPEAFNALQARVTSRDPTVEGFIVGFSLGPDPDSAYLWHSSEAITGGRNWTAFSDARVDAALDRGRYGPDCSRAARKAAYSTVDHVLNEQAPMVFLFANENTYFVTRRLVAPPPMPYGSQYDVEKWWLRP